eukprot:TRINITY_DN17270_c0_g1_i1.p1 TRINITY_DN17270_c0_g1~~TRINITY_DN17270_c0_g1_i1.p1  ORF type:complete len:236 (+),score=36.58 TRINITY_DN17270_c0_g1_i1:70-777(+)
MCIRDREKYDWRKNPFHNFNHGFTVMNSTYIFVKTLKMEDIFDSKYKFALILSALCHDIDHTGKTNMFEVNSLSQIALEYHDKSVLEQHHAATTFFILRDQRYNILENLDDEQFIQIRKLIIQNILATDMRQHFDLVKQFEHLVKIYSQNKSHLGDTEENKGVLSSFLIHTADLTGPAKQWEVAQTWSRKVAQEFSNQVVEEAKLEIPVTQYMICLLYTSPSPRDRQKSRMPSSA